MVPILGLNPEANNSVTSNKGQINTVMGKNHSARFLRAIASASGHGVKGNNNSFRSCYTLAQSAYTAEDILDFSLELFDSHPATLLGLSSEFISAPRMDDRLCSFSAIQSLINSCETEDAKSIPSEKSRGESKIGGGETGRYAKLVALFDTEEVGSVLRVGAKSNFLRSIVERVEEAFVTKAQQQGPYYTGSASNTIVSHIDLCERRP
jgi:aminopeptidase I